MPYDIAGNMVLSQPVTGFMQGRALRLAQEQQRQRGALEVAAAQRVQEEHDVNMKSAEIRFGKEKAQGVYAGALQVLASKTPKTFVERTFPDFVRAFQEQGADWESMDDDDVKEFAQAVSAHAAAELGIVPEKAKPLSEPGKVAADVQSGILSETQGAAALAPKTPGSYDEFVLAQKDPAFAKFLKERKAKGGLSLTMPDGTVLELGDVPKVGPEELAKPTINNLQETIVNSTARLDRLNATLSKYRPEFLRAKGIASAISTKVQDFVGLNVSEQQRKYLNDYTEFQSSAATDLAQILKEMSGAAVTPQEYERIEKALPSGQEMSPTEFEAKAKTAVKTVNRAIMRANWALKAGIGAKSVEQLAKMMPLDGIDAVYEQRANEIWQEMGGTPDTKAEAIKKANGEFGLGR